MSTRFRVCFFLSLVLILGCESENPTSNPGTPPPHGGNLVNLAGGKGFVEIVHKPTTDKKANVSEEVSFYFLKTMETPYSPAPTSGTFDVKKKKKVTLLAQGGALVTPPGPALCPGREVDGELTVELNGESIRIPLGVR